MFNIKVWEDEKYKISVDDERGTLIDKESGQILSDTILLGSKEKTMDHLKKLIIYKELGNTKEKVLWDNGTYELKFSWGGNSLELKDKAEDETIVQFNLKSPQVVRLIKKVIAFL